MNKIRCFIAGYQWASNFHYKMIHWQGHSFRSTENAFQWAKGIGTMDLESVHMRRFHSPVEVAGHILASYTPSQAKRMGREKSGMILRPDWLEVREPVMYDITALKYASFPEQKWLLDTGEAELEEGNWWHDNTWGNCIAANREELVKLLNDLPYQPCPKCENIVGLNLLGKTIMRVRAEQQNENNR